MIPLIYTYIQFSGIMGDVEDTQYMYIDLLT